MTDQAPPTSDRLNFESVMALLSRTLGAATVETLDSAVMTCLEPIGRLTGAEVAFATMIDDDERVSHDWHWVRPGEQITAPPLGTRLASWFGSSMEVFRLGRTVVVDDLDTIDLGPTERAAADHNRVRAIVIAPVRVNRTLLGICGVQSLGTPRDWNRECIQQVELLAQVLVQGVSRNIVRGALALADARARRIAEFIPDGLALVGLDGVVSWASPSLARMTGLAVDEIVERPAADLVPESERDRLTEALAERSPEARRLTVSLRSGGGWRWCEMTWRTVSEPGEGVPDEIVLTVRDEHERYLEYRELSALAERDHLTGTANRVTLDRRLTQLGEDEATSADEVLFLFCDIDGFKAVNDTHGHDVGDRALSAVAEALQSVVRSDDLVARVGGDEFAIVVAKPADPSTLGDRLLDAVRDTDPGPPDTTITVSIGIAGPAVPDGHTLRRLADEAMYEAKHRGKDCWVHITPDGQRESSRDQR